MSISGQNERWAQFDADQPPPPPSGQNAGWAATLGATMSAGGAGNAATGVNPSAALSDDTSLALMAFGGGWGGAPASQAAGQGSGASGASSPGSAPSAQDLAAQLLTDVQSLASVLTGTTALAGTLQQNAPATTSSPDTIASTSGSSQPGGIGYPPSDPPPWTNDISNNGTTAGSGGTGGHNPGYNDSIPQQFALSAYAATAQAGLDSSATASLASMNV